MGGQLKNFEIFGEFGILANFFWNREFLQYGRKNGG